MRSRRIRVMRPSLLGVAIAIGVVGCGPPTRGGDVDARGPDPTADAAVTSDACAAAAASQSYVGCSYWAVDLQNAIDVYGRAGVGDDCSAFGGGVAVLHSIHACVAAADGAIAGRCDPDGTCGSAGAGYACETVDTCGLDAQHSVFAVVVANADATAEADV